MANGKLRDQAPGTIINFAGSSWTLLSPSTGYLFKKEHIAERVYDPNNGKYDPAKIEHVAYYLNTTYFNTLSADDRALIQTRNWSIGKVSQITLGVGAIPAIRGMENSEQIQARISLLSVSEWLLYSKYYNNSFLEKLNHSAWLRSPVQETPHSAWHIYYTGAAYPLDITDRRLVYPALYIDPDIRIVDGIVVHNAAPTLTLNTPSNVTLYENDTFPIDGTTIDTDNGDAITVKYQINSGTVRNLHSAISDGSTPIDFSKSLTYKEGVLKDGNTVLTSVLAEGTPHTISVWAEDGNGGKSDVQTRTFYVVPNRPPSLTIDPIAAQSELINSNVINVSGAVTDPDNNDVVVTFAINSEEPEQVYEGQPSSWAFNIALKDLRVGKNTVMIKAVDIYDAETSKVLTINKTHDAVPIDEAIALYKINPPTGSAQKVLLWIERMLGDLAITAEISMTNEGEPENFVSLPRTNTGPKEGLQEDEFAYDSGESHTNIVLKIIYNRTDSEAVAAIKKISGVLS